MKAALERISAPTMVIPEMALAPDISGVCSVGGTLLMSSKPRKMASTNTVMLAMSAASARPSTRTSRRCSVVPAPPEAMTGTLRHLREKYGGIESYVRATGLRDDQIESLREAMLG